jgi:acyl dehydratase
VIVSPPSHDLVSSLKIEKVSESAAFSSVEILLHQGKRDARTASQPARKLHRRFRELDIGDHNKIHDDCVARRFGFSGGLVPGVEVYAYMAHMPVARWGRAWLERGCADCRFWKPVYDAALARITAAEESGALTLTVESAGERCATGHASIPPQPPALLIADEIPPVEPPRDRLPASEESLSCGRALGIAPFSVDRAMLLDYLADVRETEPIYRAEGLVHPGQVLRLANMALVQNVLLGPWIHVGSKVNNLTAVHIGQRLTLRSKITSNVESKGHSIVEFDAVVVADECDVAQITHTVIWRPRQVSEHSQAATAGQR